MTLKRLFLSSEEVKEGGQAQLLGSGVWTVPNGVQSISVVLIEGGAPGSSGGAFSIGSGGVGGSGGLGGRRRYINNVAVTPGQTFSYSTSARAGFFGSILTGTTGGEPAGKAGDGGIGGGAGPSQTARSPAGAGGSPASPIDATSDYLFLTVNNDNSSAQSGVFPGGGGGGGSSGVNLQGSTSGLPGAAGAPGVIMVLWPGDGRQYPTARTTAEVPNAISYDPIDLPSNASKFANNGSGVWIGVDVSSTAGRRGGLYRSADNGNSFTYIGIPYDYQLGGIAYGDGVFLAPVVPVISGSGSSAVKGLVKSVDGGVTWSLSTYTVGLDGPIEIAYAGNRFYMLGSANNISSADIAYSIDKGATWTTKITYGPDYQDLSLSHARIIPISNSALLITRSLTYRARISRDSGANWAESDYVDAARLGAVTLGIKINSNQIFSSTDDLVTSTAVPGFTMAAVNRAERILVALQDRILIIVGNSVFHYKEGVISQLSNLPTDIPAAAGGNVKLSPARRCALDGINSIISFGINSMSLNYKAGVYVS